MRLGSNLPAQSTRNSNIRAVLSDVYDRRELPPHSFSLPWGVLLTGESHAMGQQPYGRSARFISARGGGACGASQVRVLAEGQDRGKISRTGEKQVGTLFALLYYHPPLRFRMMHIAIMRDLRIESAEAV